MSRREMFRDPSARLALREEVFKNLESILAGLSPREAGVLRLRFGLLDGIPRTWDEIGQVYGVTRIRIRQIEDRTMAKLRARIDAQALKDLLDDDLSITETFRKYIYGKSYEEKPLIFCERHGWLEPSLYGTDRSCDQCPCIIRWSWTGRSRRYCSDACRQAAYRARKSATKA